MNRGLLFLSILGVGILSLQLWAIDAHLFITNSKNPHIQLSQKEVTRIFLGKMPYWPNNERVKAVYLEKSSSFLSQMVGVTYTRFQEYWLRRIYAGYGLAPLVFKDEKKMLEFIESDQGSIGILPANIALSDIFSVVEVKEQ